MRYAVVNKETKVVENVIVWDGVNKWNPPEGYEVKQDFEVGVGDVWVESVGEFCRPMSNQKPPMSEEDKQLLNTKYSQYKENFRRSIVFEDELNNPI